MDGTVRKVPFARIEVDTPYHIGYVETLCMKKPVYDLILKNLPGIRDPGNPDME